MNARQKAKQLKKIAAQYKAEADAWRQNARMETAKQHELEAKVKAIYTFKTLSREEFEHIPENKIKKELATELAQALLNANLISWRIDDVQWIRGKRYSAIIEVLKQEEEK